MNVKAIKSFYDKKEGVTRNAGDTFTVSNERYNELNATKFGILVEEVDKATKSEVKGKKKKSTTSR